MNTYNHGKIYKIWNLKDDEIYIGSTCNELRFRFSQHKSMSKSKPDRKLYQHFTLHGISNFRIELIENYNCNNRDELNKREGDFIRQLKPKLNIRIAGNFIKSGDMRQYYIDNTSEINKKINCDCGSEYTHGHKQRHMKSNKHKLYELFGGLDNISL